MEGSEQGWELSGGQEWGLGSSRQELSGKNYLVGKIGVWVAAEDTGGQNVGLAQELEAILIDASLCSRSVKSDVCTGSAELEWYLGERFPKIEGTAVHQGTAGNHHSVLADRAKPIHNVIFTYHYLNL